MTEEERELDMQLAEALSEINTLRKKLESATAEALYLRHALEHIHAKAFIATQPPEVKEHDDKASY